MEWEQKAVHWLPTLPGNWSITYLRVRRSYLKQIYIVSQKFSCAKLNALTIFDAYPKI